MYDDKRRREHILNIILIGSIVMLGILDAIVLFYSLKDGVKDQEISFAQFSLLPTFFLLLYTLSRKGFATLVSYLLVGAYFLSNSYAAYRWGVMLQTVILAYALIIIMATILRGSKFGFLITGVIAVYITPLWYAQFHKILPIQKQQLRSADGIVFSVLYFLIMIVAWLYNREIEKSLLRAETSEAELTAERDHLEITVKERTEELKRVQFEKIEQLNRFAELGQLSSGVFHDVFNLLSALSLRPDDKNTEVAAPISKTTKQINDFTQAIRKQVNNQEKEEFFCLIQSIDHVVQLLAYKALKEKVLITIHAGGREEIKTFGVPFKFHQILLNLITNAIESFDSLDQQDLRKRRVEVTIYEEDNMVILTVADNGCGMSQDVQAMIFEPFFTTKDISHGTGIGLTRLKKTMNEDLGGSVAVSSQLNMGSLFTVTFPLKYAPSPTSSQQST